MTACRYRRLDIMLGANLWAQAQTTSRQPSASTEHLRSTQTPGNSSTSTTRQCLRYMLACALPSCISVCLIANPYQPVLDILAEMIAVDTSIPVGGSKTPSDSDSVGDLE